MRALESTRRSSGHSSTPTNGSERVGPCSEVPAVARLEEIADSNGLVTVGLVRLAGRDAAASRAESSAALPTTTPGPRSARSAVRVDAVEGV